MKYNKLSKQLLEAYSELGQYPPSTVKVELILSAKIVRKIEELSETNIKSLLEKEINENGEAFIEMMGYDNF